jgi:hypothetical protein
MTINFIAGLVAAIAAWAFGAVWYMSLGKQWMAALGKSEIEIKQASVERKMPVGPMVTSFVAEVIMAAMLAGLIAHFGSVTMKTGAIVAALCWLGFVATTVTVNNAYPGRKLLLTVIDSAHWLGVLLIEGVVLGAFG